MRRKCKSICKRWIGNFIVSKYLLDMECDYDLQLIGVCTKLHFSANILGSTCAFQRCRYLEIIAVLGLHLMNLNSKQCKFFYETPLS